jgi:hypothetical protein
MKLGVQRLVWVVALGLLLLVAWRVRAQPDVYAAGAAIGPVEDRREHHFRNLTQSQTQQLFDRLLQSATAARDASSRGRALARIAALQHERGLDEAAQAAAREALRAAPNDPEVRRLLETPLEMPASH